MGRPDLAGLDRAVAALAPELIATRRHLHAHPELGFAEHLTAALVADRLARVGLAPRRLAGGTGVLAEIRGAAAGPSVLLRADMDALPLDEVSDVPYRSAFAGRAHACGHDAHVAMLLAAAEVLAQAAPRLRGSVRLLFQPAEELPPGGALAAIEDGALDGVDSAIALHVWNDLSVGSVAVGRGPVMAAHDRLEVVLRGRGGHGAMPEATRDPIVGAGYLISALQTVVARGLSPFESGVVTLGTVRAGTAFNVTPGDAELTGSIRSLGAATQRRVHERIHEVAAGTAAALGLSAEVSITELCPAVDNDAALSATLAEASAGVVGDRHVSRDFRTTAGEDFAFIAQQLPSCMVFVGSGRTDGGPVYPHHHPSFDIDEASLELGVRILVRGSLAVLGSA